MKDWIAKRPGTRPTMWWRFDAPRWEPSEKWAPFSSLVSRLPDPRLRLGGTGTPAFETIAVAPSWPLGIPDYWCDDFDQADPPVYESQAAYLKRHGLVLPGEVVTAKDREPEAAVDLAREATAHLLSKETA